MADSVQQFRIAEIEVAKALTDERIAGIFRFESTGRNKQGPTLLIVADVHSPLYAYERLLDVLNATAEQARYLVSQVDQDPLGRFEKLVQRLNEAASSFAAEEATPLNWGKINIYIIELSEGHMCFTGTGKLMNLFAQKQEDGSYRAFDLFGSLEQTRTVDPNKPFASVICGDMKPGDVLIAGSDNLERLRGDLRMKERLTSLPPVTAALEIRQDLERRGIPDDFVAVIIASLALKKPVAEMPAPAPKIDQEAPSKSTASVEQLRQHEEDANRALSPATPVAGIGGSNTVAADITAKGLGVAKAAGSWVLRILSKTFRFIRLRAKDPMALASLRGMNAGYGTVFTRQKKKVAIGVGVVVIAAVIGGVWWNHSKKVAAENAAWNSTYAQATDQRNRAESDLVYGNEARAIQEIANAQQMVADLPSNTPDRQQKLNKLTSDISDLNERLKKVVKTENVAELIALPASADPGSLTAPLLTKDTAYAVDQSTDEILKITLATKEAKRIPLPDKGLKFVASSEGSSSILFATADGKLYALDKSSDLVKAMTWKRTKEDPVTDTTLYNGRLYTLDATAGQIWRTSQSGNTFGGETGYIKAANTTINDAVALAIDSNIFVLRSNGQVVQFFSGGQVSFNLYPIQPPQRDASNLWTNADSSSLYITDPADKRVLIFDKSGTLKAQITSTQFSGPRDLSVDESNKRMVVTDGNKLLLVPLP